MATPRDSKKVRFMALKTSRTIGTTRQLNDWRGGWAVGPTAVSWCMGSHESKNKALLCAQTRYLEDYRIKHNDEN